jgi:uncharacterized protein (TIGR00369 family)
MSEPHPPTEFLDLDTIMRAPHVSALGFELILVGDRRGTLRAPWREDLVGDPDTGVIAGGVITTLLDHVCGIAIRATDDYPHPVATLDLRIDYMRPAAPRADVVAEAHCYKMTRNIAFVRAQAYDAGPDDPIATAQAAFMLTSAPLA